MRFFRKPNASVLLTYVVMIFIAVVWVLPVLWMVATALRPEVETTLMPLRWIPKTLTFENLYSVLFNSPLIRWTINSVVVASITTCIVLIADAMAAYALARIDFSGKNILFLAIIATMMIPEQVTIVPLYLLMNRFGLLNTRAALILPRTALAIGVFLLRQFFLGLPKELEEAAQIDGCNRFAIFATILLPLTKPALSALAIFTFVGSWNAFSWPLVSVTRESMFTLPIGLANFQGTYSVQYAKLMAGALVASVPVLTVFLLFQRQFVKGIALSGIKG
jgi:multiple sugar transport system permease protein